MSVDVGRLRALVDAIEAGDKARIETLASELGLRVEWYGTLFRLRRLSRSVLCVLGMPRDQIKQQMRVLFGRIWTIASRSS